MSDNLAAATDREQPKLASERLDELSLTDLFLDPSLLFARVELVDDTDALVQVMMHDLLTELLCEV